MGKQRPIDLSVFDEVVKTTKSKELDLSGFDEILKKNETLQPVPTTGTKPSKTGSLPFQSQVDTSTPSVILSDEQKLRQEQKNIGERFKSTLLKTPTKFGKVANFMDAAKKVKETLPQAPEFRRAGEIPKMQPTQMTEGQRLGESLTKGTADVRELITDKLTGKKTGLQKQLENAENAFRAYQGDEIANQAQGYIRPEETLKIKQELGFGERMSDAGTNFVNRLERFPYNTSLALGQTLTTLLGEDLGSNAYMQITRGGNAELHRMEAFDKLAKLDAETKYSKGIIDSIQDLDLVNIAGGVVDAVGSLVSTVVTSAPTAGLGLYGDMVGGGLYDFNSTKARRLGLTVDELYDTNQNEFFVPAIINGAAAKLEGIGLKGIKSAIMNNMAKGAGQKFALVGHGMNKEGVTEWLQTGMEVVNNSLAEGKPLPQAVEESVKTLFSKKGAESYLMGAIASGAAIGGGRILKGLFSDKSKKKASEAIQSIEQQQEELSNPDLSNESRVFIFENIKNNVKQLVDSVDEDVDAAEGLSAEQRKNITILNDKISSLEVVANDPAASEETKNRALESIKGIQETIDDITSKKVEAPSIPQPTFDTEESIGEEIRESNRKFEAGEIDQTTWEQEQKDLNKRAENIIPVPEEAEIGKPEEVVSEVEIKNEGKANAPTKESVTERLNINNPFYKKVEDALVKLGLIEKYNPETKTGDIVGGYVQSDGAGGFASGDMYFNADGSISYVTAKGIVSFDKNGNVISENTKQVAQEAKKTEIETTKSSITSLEKTRDSEAFKYKEATETDILGNKKRVKRLKTPQELKESTDKINDAIDKAKAKLIELEKSEPLLSKEQQPKPEEVLSEDVEAKKADIEKRREEELKGEDYRVAVSEEIFEGDDIDNEGEKIRLKIVTNKDGSRTLFIGSKGNLFGEGQGESWKAADRIGKDNTLTNSEYINAAWTGVAENFDTEGSNSVNKKPKSVETINAKYDAELAALEQQTKPKEDAVQIETAGQVPVLTEAKVGEEVEQGKPEAKPKVVTEEGGKAEEVAPEQQVGSEKTKVYHGADIDFTIEGKRNRIMFTSKNKNYAKYYAKQRGGKLFEFDVEKSKIANEEYVKNKIKSLGLKTEEGDLVEIDDNLHRLIDPRFDDTAISKEGLDELFTELEKEGYYGVDFMDENQELGGMNEIESTAIFNPKELLKPKKKPAKEQTPAQQVEQLRADEQAELKAAIPNAEQYLTDGKVDRDKIEDDKDLKKFDEIYDKYDKLITPLLPEKEVKDVDSIEEDINSIFNENQELSKIGTKAQYNKYINTIFPNSLDKKILYHGGPEGISEFDKNKLGENTKAASAALGFFFSDNKKVSESYIEKDYISYKGDYLKYLEEAKIDLKKLENEAYSVRIKLDNYNKILNNLLAKLKELIKKLYDSKYITTKELYDLELNKLNILYDKIKEEELNLTKLNSLEVFLENTGKKYFDNAEIKQKRKENKKLYRVVLNLKNPDVVDKKDNSRDDGKFYSGNIKDALDKKNDSVILKNVVDVGKFNLSFGGMLNENIKYDEVYKGTDYVVFNPNQIHILGGDSDINLFKEFVRKEKAEPAKAKALPKAKVATRLAFKKAVDLFYDISGTEGSAKKRTLAAKRKVFLEQNPSIKYIDDNWKAISDQLEKKRLITKKGNCP